MEQLQGSSITYHVAIGSKECRKFFTLQMLPTCDQLIDEAVNRGGCNRSRHCVARPDCLTLALDMIRHI